MRIVPPETEAPERIVPARVGRLQPIGDLSPAAGWTLYDPSGVIASAPVSNGSEITIGFNAVVGVAFLTRPLTTDPDQVLFLGCDNDIVVDPVTARVRLSRGVSDETGTRSRTSGGDFTPGFKRPFNESNGAIGAGSNTGNLNSRLHAMVCYPNRYPGSVARWSAGFSGVRTSTGPTQADVCRSDAFNITEESNDYECLRLEAVDGLAAETVTWDMLVFAVQPYLYDR